jgi:glycosyltransferase involved in cell wall biosynthesis
MRAPLSRVPVSSGFLESQGELIHFPHQSFVSCAVPVIYNPHDLQHRHLPWFFTAREIARREAVYRTGCEAASAVVTESAWARQDLTTSYRTDPRRVCVIPRGSPISLTPGPSDQELTATRERYALPARFMLFPAQTWPHKNHLALLHSLALLQHEGLRVPVVCTGRATPHAATIKEEARRLNLKNQVVLLGFIPACDLRALYSLATLLIFPSLFEGGGFPIIEAFTEGLPVACAASTALPEYAGDAAVLFDPGSPTSMADAIRAVWQNDSLRARLRSAGLERARFLTWEVTARLYRALYRQVAGRQISAWEASILDLARVGGAFAIARAAHAGMAPDRDA